MIAALTETISLLIIKTSNKIISIEDNTTLKLTYVIIFNNTPLKVVIDNTTLKPQIRVLVVYLI